MPPNSPIAALAIAAGLASSPMSSVTARARPPPAAISPATRSAPSDLMSATTTLAPSLARRFA